MEWTYIHPTEVGWYWLSIAGRSPEVCHLTPWKLRMHEQTPENYIKYEWYGPIYPPTKGEK